MKRAAAVAAALLGAALGTGRGPEVEDILFAYPITGVYRYRGE